METSLSVGDAEQTPRALVARERLEVTAERGRALYPLRECDAPDEGLASPRGRGPSSGEWGGAWEAHRDG